MNKHSIDLMIEKEAEILLGIEEYLEELTKGEFEHFRVEKYKDDAYWIFITFEELKYITAPLIYIKEIYEYASTKHYNSIEEVIVQFIRERLAEDIIAYINGEFEETVPNSGL